MVRRRRVRTFAAAALFLTSLALPARAVAALAWEPTGAMASGRTGFTATLLPDGRVLVVGGDSGSEILADSELYEPATGHWSATGSLATGRHGHTATRLTDGRVLVAGGWDSGRNSLASCELYDPATGQWIAAGPLATARGGHTATLLPSGEVLVAAGAGGPLGADGTVTAGDRLASTERFAPPAAGAGGSWSSAGALTTARSGHAAALLPSGKVLVVGGRDRGQGDLFDFGEPLASVELFDPMAPAASAWTSSDDTPEGACTAKAPCPMNRAHHDGTATLLHTGSLLVVAGEAETGGVAETLDVVELYDPEAGDWTTSADTMPAECAAGAGAHPGTPCPLAAARRSHSATLLPSGGVLVAGGSGTGAGTSSEVYDPATGLWSQGPDLGGNRSSHVAVLLASARVLIAGGKGGVSGNELTTAELFDGAVESWTSSAGAACGDGAPDHPEQPCPMKTARAGHTASLLPSGFVLAVGGAAADGTGTDLYDPESGKWTPSTGVDCSAGDPAHPERPCALGVGRRGHTASLLPTGKLLIAGGRDSGGEIAATELYDPATGRWASSEATAGANCLAGAADHPDSPCPMGTARNAHTATLLPTGELLVSGGFDGSEWLVSAERYSPLSGRWTPTGVMAFGRSGHTSTLLPSGLVLVAGGQSSASVSGIPRTELYDPDAATWNATGLMVGGRSDHTATLLPSGEVLTAGGLSASGGTLRSAEIYDPETGSWRATASMANRRSGHTATLLPSGRVLVAGGSDSGFLDGAELFDPATETWIEIDALEVPRGSHAATLLASGAVLATGGNTTGLVRQATTELLDPLALPDGRGRPTLSANPGPLAYGVPIEIEGSGLAGDSEAAGGRRGDSPANLPLVRMLSLASERLEWLGAEGIGGACAGAAGGLGFCATDTLTVDALEPVFEPGFYLLSVVAGGVPSEAEIVRFDCSVAITGQPEDQLDVPAGDLALFSVATQGARTFQWQQCTSGVCAEADWTDIPGATGPSHSESVEGPESGKRFRVVVGAGCSPNGTAVSEPALLTVFDDEPPVADVLTPDGGEFWLLSQPGSTNTETVSWSMSDNVRICGVRVSLLFSDDGGVSYIEVPGPALLDVDQGPNCPFPGVGATGVDYVVPEEPPSGSPGSLYKVEVVVTDHKGLQSAVNPVGGEPVRSENPFFIVGPDPSVETLILWNRKRLRETAQRDAGVECAGESPPAECAAIESDLAALAIQIRDLAAAVAGRVVDLGGVTELEELYAAWDECGADSSCDGVEEARRANRVLFDCVPDAAGAVTVAPCPAPTSGDAPSASGVHDKVLELLAIHPAIRYLVLVGGDGIVPMARLTDQTSTPEGCYPSDGGTCPHSKEPADGEFSDEVSGLSAGGTTVGRALAAGQYLSDSLLAVLERILPEPGEYPVSSLAVEDAADPERFDRFVPDLAVGRLVESPAEIAGTIVRFLGRNGNLDLTDAFAERTVVSAYDFLVDAAIEITGLWEGGLGADEVDGELVGDDWEAPGLGDEVAALRDRMDPPDGPRLGIGSLSGHATHHQLGVPGGGNFVITGLDSTGSDPPGLENLDLAGSVVYGVGCHGGLPVPDQPQLPEAKPTDLPQAFMKAGSQVYIANTGYGWGLEEVIGYGERLTQIFTEELSAAGTGTVVTGDAFRDTKRRYFAEAPRMDAYDRKSFLQWTFYGLPMYSVTTGITAAGSGALTGPEGPPSAASYPAEQRLGEVVVRRRMSAPGGPPQLASPPEFLIRLELQFDLTAPGVYRKFNDEDEATEGCQSLVGLGCYYTLNGLVERSTGIADLPVEPYLIFDSRLSGTSQHGVLWLGGDYEEEANWVPVVAELATNGGNFDDHGSTPRAMRTTFTSRRSAEGPDADDCRPQDSEINSLVAATGEALKTTLGSDDYDLHRLGRTLDLEIFYYNNTDPGRRAENCDRSGPVLGGGEYHAVNGARIDWSVPVSDAPLGSGDQGAGVWRVVVVYNDGAVETGAGGAKTGRWQPLELSPPGTPDGNGTWTGSLAITALPTETPHDFAYVLQAVDRRGNVTWSLFETTALPPSGERHNTAEVTEVRFDVAVDGLGVLLTDAPDPVLAGNPLTYAIEVSNLGVESFASLEVSMSLPEGVTVLAAGGTGWSCAEMATEVVCTRPFLDPGVAPPIAVTVFAPGAGSVLLASVAATAGADDEDVPPWAFDVETTTVLASAPPAAHAGPDREIAIDDGILLGEIPAATSGTLPYSYSWTVVPPGGAMSSSTEANPIYTGISLGTYEAALEVTDGAGLTASDSAEIRVICPLVRDLSNLWVAEDRRFVALDRIEAEQVQVLAGHLVFEAGNAIVLKEGFFVDQGAAFSAVIDSAASCEP